MSELHVVVARDEAVVKLARHLGILIRRLEIIIIFVVIIISGMLFCSLGKVDLLAAGARAVNNVVEVNLLQAVLFGSCFSLLVLFIVRGVVILIVIHNIILRDILGDSFALALLLNVLDVRILGECGTGISHREGLKFV
jgi:hypothetical protein